MIRRSALLVAVCVALVSACTSDPAPTPPPDRVLDSISPDVYRIDPGVEVAKYQKPSADPAKPPVVLVHGGGGDYRAWRTLAPELAATGRTVYAFSWLNHGGSARLPVEQFVARSILDVARVELPHVVSHALAGTIHTRVDLIGRSMGGAVALGFSASNPDTINKLVVMQPVVPSQFAPAVIPIPVDPFQPTTPGDAAQQRALFYPTLSEDEAFGAYLAFNAESPLAIWEATRWTLDIPVERITAPTLVIASDPALDLITPPSSIRALADGMGDRARFEEFLGIGHGEILYVREHLERLMSLLTQHLT
jgi:pimeloyl-ACP methyl ester carboxylesterase